MGQFTLMALRGVIALALVGSVAVQTLLVPLMWQDLEGSPDWFRVSLPLLAVVGILTLQVSAVCIWKLLTRVRRGSVFTAGSFRYVNVIIGAISAAAVVVFALAVVLAPTEIAPGLVGLVCGLSLVVAGVALLMVVMRALLVQAVEREAEAGHLRSELDGVV
jgi:hypothetical protein